MEDKLGPGEVLNQAAPAHEAIKVESVRFTGSPSWKLNDKNDTEAIAYVPNPGPINYAGEPSEEVDAAWEALLRCMFLSCVRMIKAY